MRQARGTIRDDREAGARLNRVVIKIINRRGLLGNIRDDVY